MAIVLTGVRRKVVYVAVYEAIAFACGTLGFFGASDAGVERAGALAVFASIFAVTWNFTYNALFERWESGQVKKGRSGLRRIAHAVGFEMGFLVVLMPIASWWLDISYARSFVVNLGLNLFFFFYTIAFTWAFDRVFGLPESATPPR
jgi:uncharacterized membrane protein